MSHFRYWSKLAVGVSMLAFPALASEPTVPPEPAEFKAQAPITYVPRDSILEFKSFPSTTSRNG